MLNPACLMPYGAIHIIDRFVNMFNHQLPCFANFLSCHQNGLHAWQQSEVLHIRAQGDNELEVTQEDANIPSHQASHSSRHYKVQHTANCILAVTVLWSIQDTNMSRRTGPLTPSELVLLASWTQCSMMRHQLIVVWKSLSVSATKTTETISKSRSPVTVWPVNLTGNLIGCCSH